MNGPAVLVAVDDSPAGFAAARQAITLTGALHGHLVAVTVLPPAPWARTAVVTRPSVPAHGPARRLLPGERAATAGGPLRIVAGLAHDRGVPVELRTVHGPVAQQLLDQVRDVDAAYLVVGRAHRPGAALPHIGRTAEQVLEFCDVPVLVVPVSAPGLPCGLPISGSPPPRTR